MLVWVKIVTQYIVYETMKIIHKPKEEDSTALNILRREDKIGGLGKEMVIKYNYHQK